MQNDQLSKDGQWCGKHWNVIPRNREAGANGIILSVMVTKAMLEDDAFSKRAAELGGSPTNVGPMNQAIEEFKPLCCYLAKQGKLAALYREAKVPEPAITEVLGETQ